MPCKYDYSLQVLQAGYLYVQVAQMASTLLVARTYRACNLEVCLLGRLGVELNPLLMSLAAAHFDNLVAGFHLVENVPWNRR